MDLHQTIGIGVAGNFTGHLEQAGEAADFVNVVAEPGAPKGLFPFFVPDSGNFLSTFPLSASIIATPIEGDNLQLEPEIAIICDITYASGMVVHLKPKQFAAYNDCSIRRPGARRISEKKNWGVCSKGISETLIPIDTFEEGGILDAYRLASYLLRNNELYPYGVDSPVVDYSYFHAKLLDWIIDRMNHQVDDGPLESIHNYLTQANFPTTAIISIGSTRYTSFGEKNYLLPGDATYVVAYDERIFTELQVRSAILNSEPLPGGISVLRQVVQ